MLSDEKKTKCFYFCFLCQRPKDVIHLKLIYVVLDGVGDLPIEELGGKTPLEVAETPNMDTLAENGKTGLMYSVKKGIAPESDVAVISILGYDPFKYYTGRGPLETLGADIDMKDGDLALRCNFATLGHGNKIVDRRVKRSLTTKEATELSKAINREVKLQSYPADFEFKNTIGHRAVLVIRSKGKPLSNNITNSDPAYSVAEGLGVANVTADMSLKNVEPVDGTEESRISADLVNEITQKSHVILERHEINRKRSAEGKLTANLILSRDAGNKLPKFFNINKKYGVHFLCLADMPVERGISKLASMHLTELPPPCGNLKEDCAIRVKQLLNALNSYDCFYIHLKGPDEPGHDGDYNLKANVIATIDKEFFGRFLPKIKLEDHVICVTADHATPCKLKAHSDDPVPLLISGSKIEADNTRRFSEAECKKGDLGVLARGVELMPMLMRFLKR